MKGKRKENWAELYRGFLYVKIFIREIFFLFSRQHVGVPRYLSSFNGSRFVKFRLVGSYYFYRKDVNQIR